MIKSVYQAISTPILYKTSYGSAYWGDALALLQELPNESIDLVLTALHSLCNVRRNMEI